MDLGIVKTYAFTVEPVYDDSGVDYLYSRVSGSFRAQINGQAEIVSGRAPNGPFISYKMEGGGGDDELRTFNPVFGPDRGYAGDPVPPVPGGTPGFTPPTAGFAAAPQSRIRRIFRAPNRTPYTHADIRHRLSVPRAPLLVYAGAEPTQGGNPGNQIEEVVEFLHAPEFDAPCDAKNGPFPRVLNVIEAYGDANTLVVDWQFECYINESPQNGVSWSGALLSNRFMQQHLISPDGYTAVVTSGAAIFRTDMIYALASNPDANRPLLFLPLASGFVRENIQISGLPDVTGVSYAFTDRQVPVSFPAGAYVRAASIEAVHRQAITTNADILGGLFGAYERGIGLRGNQKWAFGDGQAKKSSAIGVVPPGAGSAIQKP